MRTFACVAAMFLLCGALGIAAPIFTENFTGVAVGTYGTGSSVGGFTVTGGSVDVVGSGFFGTLCTGSATQPCVDLNGTSAGTLSTTTFNFTPGSGFVTFVLNGSQRTAAPSATVTLGSLASQTYNLTATGTNTFTLPFTVASNTSAALTFTSLTPGFEGAILDNVIVDFTAGAQIPEPSTMWLLLAGLPLLVRRKRR